MAKKPKEIPGIVTDLVYFNDMFGGKFPTGKIYEIFGFEHCGKTTLALELSKSFSAPYYIDMENELSEEYVRRIGNSNSVVTKPTTFEEGLDDFFKAIKNATPDKPIHDLLIIDTIGAAKCQAEIDAAMSDSTVGVLARKVTQFLKKAEALLKPLGITVICLNHKKDKIGGGFGEKHYTPGGRYLDFAAAYRISVTKKASQVFKDKDSTIVNLWCKKDKANNELQRKNTSYTILRGKGIHRGVEGFALGIECKAIKKDGQSYLLGEVSVRGKEAMMDHLQDNPADLKTVIKAWHEFNKDK